MESPKFISTKYKNHPVTIPSIQFDEIKKILKYRSSNIALNITLKNNQIISGYVVDYKVDRLVFDEAGIVWDEEYPTDIELKTDNGIKNIVFYEILTVDVRD